VVSFLLSSKIEIVFLIFNLKNNLFESREESKIKKRNREEVAIKERTTATESLSLRTKTKWLPSAVTKPLLSLASSEPPPLSFFPVLSSLFFFFGIIVLIRDVIYLNFCVVSGMGAAYGTAKSGVGVASMGVMRPELVMKSIVPVVMAGVLGIYGLIIAVIISTGINPKAKSYYLFDGYAHLSSGLACGLAGLSAGMAIGIVGDAGVRYSSSQFFPFHHELFF